jgi:hypothetical protein
VISVAQNYPSAKIVGTAKRNAGTWPKSQGVHLRHALRAARDDADSRLWADGVGWDYDHRLIKSCDDSGHVFEQELAVHGGTTHFTFIPTAVHDESGPQILHGAVHVYYSDSTTGIMEWSDFVYLMDVQTPHMCSICEVYEDTADQSASAALYGCAQCNAASHIACLSIGARATAQALVDIGNKYTCDLCRVVA